MAWFDGTFDYTDEELNNEFPLSVIESLRMSADGKRVAVINDFERESELFDLRSSCRGIDSGGTYLLSCFSR